MQIQELWSQSDQTALATFEVAVKNRDLAGALLAIEGASASGSAACRHALHLLGGRVRLSVPAADPPTALARVLVDQEGFRGDKEDYYNPRNSYLSAVVERRRGLPILLAAVWMLTGEQAGLPVEGVGLPGHFVVRVGGPAGVLVDPFGGGNMLSHADCAKLVSAMADTEIEWNDEWLASATLDTLLERVLRNLMNAFQRSGEPEMLYRTARFYVSLRPHEAEPQLVHARLAEAMGAQDKAKELYRAIQDHFPGTQAADLAGTRIVELRDEPVEIN